MNTLLVRIGQLSVFLICAQTLIHFRPKESYEKYIKLLVSIMLLILLVEPVMELLGEGETGGFWESVQGYENRLQEIMSTPQLDTGEIEQILQNITDKKVQEGFDFVQQESNEEIKKEIAAGSSSVADEETENKSTVEIEVDVEKIEKIETVKIGADYGKSGKNP